MYEWHELTWMVKDDENCYSNIETWGKKQDLKEDIVCLGKVLSDYFRVKISRNESLVGRLIYMQIQKDNLSLGRIKIYQLWNRFSASSFWNYIWGKLYWSWWRVWCKDWRYWAANRSSCSLQTGNHLIASCSQVEENRN